MQSFRLMTLLAISFAAFHVAYGDGNKTDVSYWRENGQELANFERENDDELEDEAAHYRWLAPLLFDELKEREKRAANNSQSESEAQEVEILKTPKNKGKKNKGKNKKKKKKSKKNKKPKRKFKKAEQKIWFEPLACYRDKGPKAWKNPQLRALKILYKNLRGNINWAWGDYFEIIMSCAQAAQARGCKCFGIQFHGECWCDQLACVTYNMYGSSSKCTKGVGLHWANFVYRAKCGSVYGCCPDGAMPAPGPNFQGCPDCTTTVDVVFLADSSGSIGKNNFQMVKQILLRLIRHYSVSESYARIGIIKYHSFPRRVVNLLQSQKLGFLNLERKIRKMRYTKGGTRTGKALAMADKMLKGSRRRLRGKFLQHEQVCVVMTDGLTNRGDIRTLKQTAAALKLKGTRMIAVGVAGKGYNAERKRQQKAELSEIASSPQDVFYEASFEQVRDHVDPIAKRACPLFYKRLG